MKRLFLVAFAVLFIAGCKPSDSQLIKIGQDKLAENLKDPASAQFKGMFFHPDSSQSGSNASGYVCGELNGKNSYGAYVGYERVYIHVKAKPRWLIPLFGVSYSTSEPFKVDEGDGLQAKLDKLKMYVDRCEQ